MFFKTYQITKAEDKKVKPNRLAYVVEKDFFSLYLYMKLKPTKKEIHLPHSQPVKFCGSPAKQDRALTPLF